MSTRKPAASTLLKKANEEIESLKKKLESAERNSKYNADQSSAFRAEVDELHAFFDALPGVIPRKAEDGYTQRAAMTRLAAWLATK